MVSLLWKLYWLVSFWVSCSVQLTQHFGLLAILYHFVSYEPGVLGWFMCSLFWLVLHVFFSQNTALSVLLAVCNSADDTLEAELKASVLGVLSQFWSFLQAKQVREFAAPVVKTCLGEAGVVSSSCYSFVLLGLDCFSKAQCKSAAYLFSSGLSVGQA